MLKYQNLKLSNVRILKSETFKFWLTQKIIRFINALSLDLLTIVLIMFLEGFNTLIWVANFNWFIQWVCTKLVCNRPCNRPVKETEKVKNIWSKLIRQVHLRFAYSFNMNFCCAYRHISQNAIQWLYAKGKKKYQNRFFYVKIYSLLRFELIWVSSHGKWSGKVSYSTYRFG